jgi:hypothetical protein
LIEKAMRDDIASELGGGFKRDRFYPYLSMHEFEGLLFSNPKRLAEGIGRPDLELELSTIRSEFLTPEDINDDRTNAPSKRLGALVPDYDKVIGGNVAAMTVGLPVMKRECEHFRRWLEWFASVQESAN